MTTRLTRRTFLHRRDAGGPFGARQLECGCWVDLISGSMREPCMAHEGEGHLSAISEQDALWAVRCLVGICPWGETWAREDWAVAAAQKHWDETRNEHVG